VHFRVRPSSFRVETATHHHAFWIDDEGANHWIGTGPAAAALSNRERAEHVIRVGGHG
jgi:hypothetical protein